MKKLSDRFMYYCGLLATKANVDDLKHIQNLIDAEEAGLLLCLPVKIGTPVFRIVYGDVQNPHIRKTRFKVEDIGAWNKTVFENRNDAVAALYYTNRLFKYAKNADKQEDKQ